MLDGSMIEVTADAILAAGNGKNSASQLSALKKELAELEAKINNLIHALAGGLNSSAVRDKLTEYEGNKRILEQKIKELRPKPTLSREYLIKEPSRDAERLQNSPDCIKELLQKYIVKIDVFDEAIIIHSTADLSGALPAGGVKLPVNGKIAGNNSDDLSADGCGGSQHSLPEILFRYVL